MSTSPHTAAYLQPDKHENEFKATRIRGRLCLSLDEKALYDLHYHQHSTSTSQEHSPRPSEQSPQRRAPEPFTAPYAPPQRAPTPDGVPSWPTRPHLPPPNYIPTAEPRGPDSLVERGCRRIGKSLRRAFSFKRRPETPRAAAPWRPPVSGHTTFRFGALEAHPFSQPLSVPFIGPIGRGKDSRSESRQRGASDDSVPLLSNRRPSRDSNYSIVVTPSVRALAAVNGTPLPVPSEQIATEVARRSSSIPSRLRSQRRASYPSSTAKTADLIEAFPRPPCTRMPRVRHSAPARMSLFPALEALQERMSGALPNPPACDGSADAFGGTSPPIRGESSTRFRYSGIPVYDGDTASMLDIDQAEERTMVTSLNHPHSPTSATTGATRYFSAASQPTSPSRDEDGTLSGCTASGTEAEECKHCRRERHLQRKRAITNGALRFMSQTLAAPRQLSGAATSRKASHASRSLSAATGSSESRPARQQTGVDGTQEDERSQSKQWRNRSRGMLRRARVVVKRAVRFVTVGKPRN